MTNKDAEKAFACATGTPENGHLQEGMSLRDQFAGQALAAIGTWAPNSPAGFNLNDSEVRRERALWAYAQADAMLAARATPQPDPVREELAEALEDAREWMSSVEMHLRDSAVFKQSMQRIEAALSKAREGQS